MPQRDLVQMFRRELQSAPPSASGAAAAAAAAASGSVPSAGEGVPLLTEIRLLLTIGVLLASTLCSRAVLSEADPKRSAITMCSLFISSVLYETWQATLWPAFPMFFSLSRTLGTWLGAALLSQPAHDLRAGSCHYYVQLLLVPLIGLLWGLEEIFTYGHNSRAIAVSKGSVGFWTAVLLSVLVTRINKLSLFVPAGIVAGLGVALYGAVFEAKPEAIVAGCLFSARVALSEFVVYDRGANPIRLLAHSAPVASLVVSIAFFVELGISSGAFWSRHVIEAIGVAIPGATLAFGVSFALMRALVASNSLAVHSWIALMDIGLLPIAARAAGIDPKMSLALSPVNAIGSLLAASFGAFGVNNDKHPAGASNKVDLGADDDAVVAKSADEESEWLLRGEDDATAADLHATLGDEKVI